MEAMRLVTSLSTLIFRSLAFWTSNKRSMRSRSMSFSRCFKAFSSADSGQAVALEIFGHLLPRAVYVATRDDIAIALGDDLFDHRLNRRTIGPRMQETGQVLPIS